MEKNVKEALILDMICDDITNGPDDVDMGDLMEYFRSMFNKYGLSEEDVTYEDLEKGMDEAQFYIDLEFALDEFKYTHPYATDGEISDFIANYIGE